MQLAESDQTEQKTQEEFSPPAIDPPAQEVIDFSDLEPISGGWEGSKQMFSDDMDEEELKFFKSLERDMNDGEVCDSSKATTEMVNLIKQEEDLEREEAKEEEYDYFLQEENQKKSQAYHVLDEADLEEDEEDNDPFLDEDERRQQYNEMFKEFKENIEREQEKEHKN